MSKIGPTELAVTSNGNVDGKSAASGSDDDARVSTVPIVYTRRWLVLAAFALLSCSNATQWIVFGSVADKVSDFYGVSLSDVNWFSMCWMVVYLIGIVPCNMFIDRFGLYISVLMGAILNCIAGVLKIVSASPSLYWLALLSECIAAVAQLPILGVPPLIAATWFSVEQVATATAIGVFGNQVGIGVGFLIPPLIVKNSSVCEVYNGSMTDNCTYEVTRESMQHLGYFTTGFTAFALLIIIFVFRNKPPTPPSAAQAAAADSEIRGSFVSIMKALFTHRGFVLLFTSYGIIAGCFYSYGTLLNSIVLDYAAYQGDSKQIGDLGLTLTLAGIVGAIVVGPILDKTRKYKFFMTGYMPIGFEFAAEITYPISENTTAGLLNAASQIVGLILTGLGQVLIDSRLGSNGCMVMYAVFIMVGTLLSLFIPEILVRHHADEDQEYRRRATTSEPSSHRRPTLMNK